MNCVGCRLNIDHGSDTNMYMYTTYIYIYQNALHIYGFSGRWYLLRNANFHLDICVHFSRFLCEKIYRLLIRQNNAYYYKCREVKLSPQLTQLVTTTVWNAISIFWTGISIWWRVLIQAIHEIAMIPFSKLRRRNDFRQSTLNRQSKIRFELTRTFNECVIFKILEIISKLKSHTYSSICNS